MSLRLQKLVINEGCKYLKVLQPGTYDFLDENSVEGFYGKNIEISAIVGKNGCGKSSLLEIIFRMMNNLSVFITHGTDAMHRIRTVFVTGLDSDLFYSIDGVNCLLSCRDKSIALTYGDVKWRFGNDSTEFADFPDGNSMSTKEKVQMCKYIFFTLISNYSVQAYIDDDYASNSSYKLEDHGKLQEDCTVEPWIHYVFHKNDGYISAININPLRKNGNIDMLTEEKLQRQRMEFLLLHYHKHKKEFIHGYTLSRIEYKLNLYKLYHKFSRIETNKTTNDSSINERDAQFAVFKEQLSSTDSIARSILHAIGIKRITVSNDMLVYSYLYIVYKVLSIARTYPAYSKYSSIANIDLAFYKGHPKQRNLATELGKKVMMDHSHITNKIYQTLNFIKMVNKGFLSNGSESFTWKDYDNNRIKDELNTSTEIENEIKCLPPPFFDYKIYLKHNVSNQELPIEHMSAGERQLYYILSTLIYHILNIKSVDTRRIHYRNVAIVLDEVELGFHPDYQRKFIKFLVDTFERLKLNQYVNFHFIITTHSPFLLSDMRKSNIIYLENGYSFDKNQLMNPFGANINDILAQSFFLADGFMGDFAKKKISSLLIWLTEGKNDQWDATNAKQLIDSLTEPIIKSNLQFLLDTKIQEK